MTDEQIQQYFLELIPRTVWDELAKPIKGMNPRPPEQIWEVRDILGIPVDQKEATWWNKTIVCLDCLKPDWRGYELPAPPSDIRAGKTLLRECWERHQNKRRTAA